ncbi:eukaryotic translation initiation factor 4E type 3-like [Bacillus rossius redtenbacheri]|uniref:eukaryotic translation initiation factor 4E type 3-like n=1 Tax=Bacillus rossius redtenbacheri TaxID=93214 RepID=UPI002FDF084E
MASSGSESNDSACDLSKSPVFSSITIDNLRSQETSGIPLNTPWTFWLDKAVPGVSAAEFKANLKRIYTVSTVQSFWAVYNHIPDAADIPVRYSYHMMREDRKPLWEEPYNQHGGTWRFKCWKKDTSRVWKELLVAVIGESFADCLADGDEICGVSVTVREKDDLVQVWNKLAKMADDATILAAIQRLLPDVSFPSQYYKQHQKHHAYEGSRR